MFFTYSFLLVSLLVSATCAAACPVATTRVEFVDSSGRVNTCQDERVGEKEPWNPDEGTAAESGRVEEPPIYEDRWLEGTAVIWHSSGKPRAHGHYVPMQSGPTLPSGEWTFWHENGRPKSAGRYLNGTPVGCFSSWDEQGSYRGYVYDESIAGFVEDDCIGPPGAKASTLFESLMEEEYETGRVDIAVGGMVVGEGLSLEGNRLVQSKPGLGANLELRVRIDAGPIFTGVAARRRSSEDGRVKARELFAVVSYERALPIRHLQAEGSILLGVGRLEAPLQLEDLDTLEPLERFDRSTYLAALELGLSYLVLDSLALVGVWRLERGLSEAHNLSTQFCFEGSGGCPVVYQGPVETNLSSMGVLLSLRWIL